MQKNSLNTGSPVCVELFFLMHKVVKTSFKRQFVFVGLQDACRRQHFVMHKVHAEVKYCLSVLPR